VGKAARVTGVLSFMPKMIRGPNSVKRAPITLGPAGYRAGRVRSDDARRAFLTSATRQPQNVLRILHDILLC
jgi:hypothetical protein